ncbi:type IV pilin N-terminal domain-containing protein [Haloterrigena sp. SYSU A558-1]|uniref:Type IV pilin N-terminal domain-containing protein n=1 Tax=Haloterrigena gelatinilytica TaxID=2741724 RepID=A0ABX2LQ25_9EURY|nr:type IV pilin N-terminal domain-containing protein [Haloterrigena gelatinilytica]NUC75001.1 type IV pilin N-terminal domain-containing protein [Haloterrigena gelatinilytica]
MATNTQRAISPVIGTVALLIITVLLAATVAGFVLMMDMPTEPSFETTDEPDAPTADFSASASRTATTLEHVGGDRLDAARVTIVTADGTQSWGDGEIQEGDRVSVSGDVERVEWSDGERTVVLAEFGE